MAENVRQGFRAGGRAPFGYKLDHIKTGAIRDGKAITKSKLILSDDAEQGLASLGELLGDLAIDLLNVGAEAAV